ncbi:MAG TPA: hypothetical protein VHB97_07775 [Polyangia bacterium]|jgi:hypothetical protein|nr:hypothetical protein [Polyangia bacterium]
MQLPSAPHRLGWITWSDVNEIVYCNQRLDDAGNRVGVLGPCWQEAAGEPPKKMMSWLNAGRPDETLPNAVPWQRCSVELHDGSAVMHTPTTQQQLELWHAAGNDAHTELSFSPEGKWMAIVDLVVHRGEGEQIVEIDHVLIEPVPACR